MVSQSQSSLLRAVLVILLSRCMFLSYKIRIARSFTLNIYGAQNVNEDDLNRTVKAMKDARESLQNKLSPGAGLRTADEQADAAYADLINTSMDQRGITDLSKDELDALTKGGYMWERGAVSQTRKFGVFGDLMNVIKAVAGGAQIEKNKYGET